MAGCEEIQDDLSAFLDGELPAAECALVQEHLKTCPACQALLADLQTVRTSLKEMPGLSAPPSLAATVRQNVRASLPAAKPLAVVVPEAALRRRFSWHSGLSALAALLVLAVLLFWVLPQLAHAPSESAALPRQAPAASMPAAPKLAKEKPGRSPEVKMEELVPRETESAKTPANSPAAMPPPVQPLARPSPAPSGFGGGTGNAAPISRPAKAKHPEEADGEESTDRQAARAPAPKFDGAHSQAGGVLRRDVENARKEIGEAAAKPMAKDAAAAAPENEAVNAGKQVAAKPAKTAIKERLDDVAKMPAALAAPAPAAPARAATAALASPPGAAAKAAVADEKPAAPKIGSGEDIAQAVETVVLQTRNAAQAEAQLKTLAETLGARIEAETDQTGYRARALLKGQQSTGAADKEDAAKKRIAERKVYLLHVPADKFTLLREEIDKLRLASSRLEKGPPLTQDVEKPNTATLATGLGNENAAEPPSAPKMPQQTAPASASTIPAADALRESASERVLRIEIVE